MTGWTPRERFQRALGGQHVDRPPVWLMRQAGRSLPEYRKLRQEHGFREVCTTPDLARRVTLQPVDRFGVDVAVVFSDILLTLDAFGLEVRYGTGTGPQVGDPIRDPERVDELEPPDPGDVGLDQARAVSAVRQARPGTGIVGFAGAPFTLACYAIEGASPRRYEHVHRFRHEHPEAFARLLDRFAEAIGHQLGNVVSAGADAVQLFDTHAEVLAAQEYAGAPRESTQRALDTVRGSAAGTILFARGSSHLIHALGSVDVDALSLDWRIRLDEAIEVLGPRVLQGNLDPSLLHAPPGRARRRAREVLEAGRAAEGHVFNLGHGVTPNARVETIGAVVDAVKAEAER